MKNLVFLTGGIINEVEFAYEIDDRKFFRFTVETVVNDRPEYVDCIAPDTFKSILEDCQLAGTSVTISGTFRSKKTTEKRNETYVYCKDVIMALPFSSDENTVILEGSIMGAVKAYASRSVAFMKAMVTKNKWAFVPIIGYQNVGRRMALLKKFDVITVRGYVHTDEGFSGEVVVNDFTIMKGDMNNEIFESYGDELQRTEPVRSESEQRPSDGLRSKPHWKNDGYGCRVRHSDRKDVRRFSYRHGQTERF